jgi:hypothetical protein
MREEWECEDVERVKPLDQLLDDKMEAFESGRDKKCDKDLDAMIWELGDFENEEPPQEAEEFAEEPPVEEELIEKKLRIAVNGKLSFVEGKLAEETPSPGERVVGAVSIGPETARGRKGRVRGNSRSKLQK